MLALEWLFVSQCCVNRERQVELSNIISSPLTSSIHQLDIAVWMPHYLHVQPSRCFFLHRILLCECVCWAAVRSYITRLWTIKLYLKGLLTHCRRHSHIMLFDVGLMDCAVFFSHSDPDQCVCVCLLRIKNKSLHDFIQSTELYNQRKWVNKEKVGFFQTSFCKRLKIYNKSLSFIAFVI